MKFIKTMIPFISNLLNLPIRKVDILKRAKRYRTNGLCYAIIRACEDYHLDDSKFRMFIPEFNIDTAMQYGASKKLHNAYGYWWHCGVWDTGRMDFLNHLIEFYKDDKDNVRNYETL